MKRILLLSASVFAVSWATGAVADSPNLKGDYGFTASRACLVAPGSVSAAVPLPGNPTPGVALPNSGFQADLRPNDSAPGLTSDAFVFSETVEGIRTFNGDGTGSVSATAIGITQRPTPGPNGYPHFPAGAQSRVFSYRFTYTVDGNSWTANFVPGSFSQTFITGSRSTQNPANAVNQTGTVDTIPTVSGLMSKDGKTLIAVHAPIDPTTGAVIPTVQTVTFSNGDVDPQICHESIVFISLSK